MSQRVGADLGVQAGHPEIFIHFSTDTSGAEPLAVLVGEEYPGFEIAVDFQPIVSEFKIVLDGLHCS